MNSLCPIEIAVILCSEVNAPPNQTPYEINLMIAAFGGFPNRMHDGCPGAKVMRIGLQRLKDFILTYEVYSYHHAYGEDITLKYAAVLHSGFPSNPSNSASFEKSLI